MAQIDLWLDDEDVQAANSAGSFTFDIPGDAVRKGNIDDPNDEKARATFVQKLQIVEVKMYEDETFPTAKDATRYPCVCIELKFQVPSDALRKDGTADPNSGKSNTQWYRVVPAALKNKKHPKYKANNYATGTLNSILRSVWGSQVIPHGAGVNLGDFYGGDTPAVLNTNVVCTIKATRYEGERKDELRDFVPFELIPDWCK